MMRTNKKMTYIFRNNEIFKSSQICCIFMNDDGVSNILLNYGLLLYYSSPILNLYKINLIFLRTKNAK